MPARNSPLSLNQRVIDIGNELRRMRAGMSAGGFDPNADPVVIGSGASATTGSLRGVVVGFDAVGDAWGVISIGWTAHASDGGGSLNGPIAIGVNAYTTADDGTAVGGSSQAAGVNSSAFGVGADAHYINSTAIGAYAICNDDHQIMLGSPLEFVEIPGDSSTAPNGLVLTDTADGTRYIVQITSGALVLNAAP